MSLLFRRWGAVALLGVVLLSFGLSSCKRDRTRRLSEGEALQFKRELLRENPGAISSDQAQLLGLSQARTKEEIEESFEELEAEHAREKEVDRLRWLEEQRTGGNDG